MPAERADEAPDEFLEDEEMEAELVKSKKLPGAVPKAESKPKQQSYTGWLPRGGERRHNDGKGGCLFYSVQQALEVLEPHAKKRSARQLRAFTVAFMKRHMEEYEVLWDRQEPGKRPEDADQAPSKTTWMPSKSKGAGPPISNASPCQRRSIELSLS